MQTINGAMHVFVTGMVATISGPLMVRARYVLAPCRAAQRVPKRVRTLTIDKGAWYRSRAAREIAFDAKGIGELSTHGQGQLLATVELEPKCLESGRPCPSGPCDQACLGSYLERLGFANFHGSHDSRNINHNVYDQYLTCDEN